MSMLEQISEQNSEQISQETQVAARNFTFILLLFLITRIILYFVGYLGVNLFPSYIKEPVYLKQDRTVYSQLELETNLSLTKLPGIKDFEKFDSYWYMGIVERGYDKYKINDDHPQANWVFFPLFPLIIAVLNTVINCDNVMLSVFLSNIFLYISMIYLFKICKLKGLADDSSKTVLIFLLFYPTSIFYAVPYTESLFLFLSTASIYYTMQDKYFLAFLFAGFSTVTRIMGFVNIFFIISNAVLDKKFKFSLRDIKLFLHCLMACTPLFTFFIYMKWLTGDYLAPLHEQSIHWFRQTTIPFIGYFKYILNPYFSTKSGWENGFISFFISSIVLLIFIWYLFNNFKNLRTDKKELLFYIYALLLMVIPFSSAIHLQSIPRYLMLNFPLFIFMALLLERRLILNLFFSMLFFALNVIFTICFFNDYFFVV